MATDTVPWSKDLVPSEGMNIALPISLLTHEFISWCIKYLNSPDMLYLYTTLLIDHRDRDTFMNLYCYDSYPNSSHIIVNDESGLVNYILNLSYEIPTGMIPIVINCHMHINPRVKSIIEIYEPDINIDNEIDVLNSKTLVALLQNHPYFVNCDDTYLELKFIPEYMKNYYTIDTIHNFQILILHTDKYEKDQLKNNAKLLIKNINELIYSDKLIDKTKISLLKSLFIKDDIPKLDEFAKRFDNKISSMCSDGGVEETKSDD